MISSTVSLIDFGKVQIIGTAPIKKVSIKNDLSEVVPILAVSDNPVFSVMQTSGSPGFIGANSNAEFSISYSPTALNLDNGTLTFTSSTFIVIIKLRGTGDSAYIEVKSQLQFGASVINHGLDKQLTITNRGNFVLTINNISSDNFQFSTQTTNFSLNPTKSKTITITFIPSQIGRISGNLSIFSNDFSSPITIVALSGNGVDSLILVSPQYLDFGKADLINGKQLPITITNNGGKILDTSSIICLSSVFTVDPTILHILPATYAILNVKFLPIAQAIQTVAPLTITFVEPEQPSISIELTGIGASPKIVLDKSSITFKQTIPNSQVSDQLQIQNTGNLLLNVLLTFSSVVFNSSSSSLSIAAGQTETITVNFNPTTIGDFSGKLLLSTNDVTNQNLSVDLTGTATTIPKISISPTSLNFGSVSVTKTGTMTLVVKNIGNADLTFNTKIETKVDANILENLGSFNQSPSSGSIAPLAETTISVIFGPKDSVQCLATLKIKSNDPSNPEVDVTLSGQGTVGPFTWSSFDLSKLKPQIVSTVAKDLTTVVNTITTAITLVKSILDLIKSYIIDVADPLKLIVQAIILFITDFESDLETAGIYRLLIFPGDKRVNPQLTPQYFVGQDKTKLDQVFGKVSDYFDSIRGGASAFISKIVYSFDDPADSNRPQFTSEAEAGAVVLAADSGSIGDIMTFVTKISKLFKLEFQSICNYDPPTNINAIAGQSNVRLTFVPNDGLVTNAYLIFRSNVMGGEIVPNTVDSSGHIVTSYDLVGLVDTNTQLAKIFDIPTADVDSALQQSGSKFLNFLKDQYASPAANLGQQITGAVANAEQVLTGNFIYEDNSVSTGLSYFYVITAASVDKKNDAIKNLLNGGTTTLTSDQLIDIVTTTTTTDTTGKTTTTKKIVPKFPSDLTGINSMGPFSSESNASPSSGFTGDTTNGLARCRFYRCQHQKSQTEQTHTGAQIAAATTGINLTNFPILSTLQITLTNASSDVINIDGSCYRVDGKTLTFLDVNAFDDADKIDISYQYDSTFNVKPKTESINTQIPARSTISVTLKSAPIDPTSVTILLVGVAAFLACLTVNIPITNFTVINPITGILSITVDLSLILDAMGMSSATYNSLPIGDQQIVKNIRLSISYDYIVRKPADFKCINPEFNKFYFDFQKCAIGTTLCPGYQNRNCIYNNGKSCTIDVGQTSKRLVLQDIASFFSNSDSSTKAVNSFLNKKWVQKPEEISFLEFWDPVLCQNGYMAQRCDGYTLTAPRTGYKGTPPDWEGLKISLLDMIPPIKDVLYELKKVLNGIVSGTNKFSDTVLGFINMIEKRIDNLNLFLDKINAILKILDQDFSSPNFYVLSVPPAKGGNNYLKQAISTATGGPSSDTYGYTAGIVLVYGGPNVDVIATGFKLLFG